jgi:hypothetical protein
MTQIENLSNLPETSPQFDIVMKNLAKAKKEMGSTVKKDSKNPFHKSTYASLSAHLDLCENVLDKNGLILLHTINGSYEKAILIASLYHVESGQWIKSYLPLPNPKNDSQGLGASITYMRRYSINSMLGLSAEDDDGETNSVRATKKETDLPKKISSQQVSSLKKLEIKLNEDLKKKMGERLKKSYQSERFEDIPEEEFLKVYAAYENSIKYQDQQKVELAQG